MTLSSNRCRRASAAAARNAAIIGEFAAAAGL
jgi:hypothetical protein